MVGSGESKILDEVIVFGDERTQEYKEQIESQLAATKSGKSSTITADDGEEIDVDDI
jgi:hypothetical protein